jgi:hypothetical protein
LSSKLLLEDLNVVKRRSALTSELGERCGALLSQSAQPCKSRCALSGLCGGILPNACQSRKVALELLHCGLERGAVAAMVSRLRCGSALRGGSDAQRGRLTFLQLCQRREHNLALGGKQCASGARLRPRAGTRRLPVRSQGGNGGPSRSASAGSSSARRLERGSSRTRSRSCFVCARGL